MSKQAVAKPLGEGSSIAEFISVDRAGRVDPHLENPTFAAGSGYNS